MFCLGHFYIKGSIVQGCKVHVISVKMKSMSVTLFKILTISCCLPEDICHKLLNLPAPYNCVLIIYLCYLKFLTSLLAVHTHTHTQQQLARCYFSLSSLYASCSCIPHPLQLLEVTFKCKKGKNGVSLQQFTGCL
jgi:hypothetical protein